MTEKQEKELEQKLYKNFWCYGDSLKDDTLQIDPTLTPKELATWINQNFISRDEMWKIIEDAVERGCKLKSRDIKNEYDITELTDDMNHVFKELKSKYLA